MVVVGRPELVMTSAVVSSSALSSVAAVNGAVDVPSGGEWDASSTMGRSLATAMSTGRSVGTAVVT